MSAAPPRVFLIGARGAGKTTIARTLADRLGWAWVDLDAEVETAAGRSVARIFAEEGEPAFRAREDEALANACGRDRLVVATGGGVVLRPSNQQRLRLCGMTVWLTADADTLWGRIASDPGSADRRPDLGGGGVDEVRHILATRAALYRDWAAIEVPTGGRTPTQIADDIARRLAWSAIEVSAR